VNDALMLAFGRLADDAPRDTGPDFGKASPVGLVIVVLLLIATFLLVWSMNRHLRKLPRSFDRDRPEPDKVLDEGTVGADPDSTTEDRRREPGG
jgi:hypothetical protein